MCDATKRITNVYHWPNGMTMVFDQHGKQMPEFQGKSEEILPKLVAAGWKAASLPTEYQGCDPFPNSQPPEF